MIEPRVSRQKCLDVIYYLERVIDKLDKASEMVWVLAPGEGSVNELAIAIKTLKELKAELENSESEYDTMLKNCVTNATDLAVMTATVEKLQDRVQDLEDAVFEGGGHA
jgi:polyhydroxyalkanoate synthesis regulator phasin